MRVAELLINCQKLYWGSSICLCSYLRAHQLPRVTAVGVKQQQRYREDGKKKKNPATFGNSSDLGVSLTWISKEGILKKKYIHACTHTCRYKNWISKAECNPNPPSIILSLHSLQMQGGPLPSFLIHLQIFFCKNEYRKSNIRCSPSLLKAILVPPPVQCAGRPWHGERGELLFRWNFTCHESHPVCKQPWNPGTRILYFWRKGLFKTKIPVGV